MNRRLIGSLPALTLILSACGTGTGSLTTIGVLPRGELTLSVTGLPADSAADVTVQGPGLTADLTGSRVLNALPFGTYDVTARTVMAGGAPYLPVVEPAQVTFNNRVLQATVKVQYDLPATGQLTLNVAGVPAGNATRLHITGPDGFKRDLAGEATQTLTQLTPGEYNVTADSLRFQDFTYPATVQGSPVVVQRGRTSVTNVAYARDPRFGHLAVRLLGLPEGTPGALRVTDAGGQTRDLTASGILTDLAQGEAQVVAAEVRTGGMTYRAPAATVKVMGASVATLDVPYAPVTGRLRVVVNSPVTVPAGSVSVTGGHALSATTTLDNLDPGTYELSAKTFTAEGWTYVPDLSGPDVKVTAGQTAGVTVTYVPEVAQPGVERDFTAPQVTLETEALGEDRTLRGHAQDDRGEVWVTVFVGSALLGEASIDAAGQWTLTWPETQPQLGEHDVTVVARDAAGNETRATRTVEVRGR